MAKKQAINTENLTLRYGSLKAVDRFTFSVNSSEISFLLGPNGAGKTTLIKMICGLLKADSGSINILGSDLATLKKKQFIDIGYCPQHISIWKDLTCIEQLIFMAQMYGIHEKEAKERATSLLNSLFISDKKHKLAGQLSGGMQRCLSLILSMIHDPKILILDEPFTGLDIQSRIHLRKKIHDLAHKEGKAILISTHNFDEAERLANRVAIMDHGTLLRVASPGEFKTSGKKPSTIEVNLSEVDANLVECLTKEISKLSYDFTRFQDTLIIQTQQGIIYFEPIFHVLKKYSLESVELQICNRSLENVFLELTERKPG